MPIENEEETQCRRSLWISVTAAVISAIAMLVNVYTTLMTWKVNSRSNAAAQYITEQPLVMINVVASTNLTTTTNK